MLAVAAEPRLSIAKKVGQGGHHWRRYFRTMLGRARELTPAGAPVEFVLADATVYPFAPASTDLLFSRFGVMFFAQPSVPFQYAQSFAAGRTPRVHAGAHRATIHG